MPALHAFVAVLGAANNSPIDWVYGTAASIVFVALIAIPAAALNARDRKRRQQTGQS
ncbi:MAG TPA: hypothetical protein VK425_11750 [Acidimicrobiales bacterium]|nr:hypothetical protein [Acidimicrobiales bacterium]